MIGSIKGRISNLGEDFLLIETASGVGYIIFTLSNIIHNTKLGDEISLITETIVREDSIKIFGFNNISEKRLFLKLSTVKGIGAKTALNMLSIFEPETLIIKIIEGDIKAISTTQGVGKKTAERIITELKDDLQKQSSAIVSSNVASSVMSANMVSHQGNSALNEAKSALINLGYNDFEISSIIKNHLNEEELKELETEEAIKQILQHIGKYKAS